MNTSAKVTRVALVQLCADTDVAANLATTERLVRQAADQGAQVVLLPEAFAFIGPDRLKREILEPVSSSAQPDQTPILNFARALASDCEIDLVLGGHHELSHDPARSYNTCVHLNPAGEIAATYRKIHLFDVQLSDGTQLQESAKTLAGDTAVVTEMPFGILGLSICYDLRFPYLYQQLVDMGAIALNVPSAFTATTGAAHWHTLLRARAIESQCYVFAPAQHGQHSSKRRSFGHSLIVDPWGEIVSEKADGDGLAIADIDPARVAQVRRELPSLEHRRELASQ